MKFEKNQYALPFDDPALKTALAYAKDFYYDSKYRGVFGNEIFESWYQGKNAFWCEYAFVLDGKIIKAKSDGTFTFDYGVAGMPCGPDNTEHPCHTGSVAVVRGSKSPCHSGDLIEMILKRIQDDYEAKNANRPAEAI